MAIGRTKPLENTTIDKPTTKKMTNTNQLSNDEHNDQTKKQYDDMLVCTIVEDIWFKYDKDENGVLSKEETKIFISELINQ